MLNEILNSGSIGEASMKIFGYSNSKTSNIIKDTLKFHGFDVSIFKKDKGYKCLYCYKPLNKGKTFCSISCSNKIPKRKKLDFIKPRNSKKLKEFSCDICKSVFTKITNKTKIKTCSKECRNKLNSITLNRRVESGEHHGWISRNKTSYPEKYFMSVLDKQGIEYSYNYPISQSSLGYYDKGSYYSLDFLIVKNGKKIDLEIDGAQHELKERKISDSIRNEILTKNGYLVYRIKWNQLTTIEGKKLMQSKIEDFLYWYKKL